MRNIAIILAGGTGSRMGGGMPKQLLTLADGQTILEHSVAAFEQAECIDEIGIVMHPDYIACAEEMLLRNGWQKVAFIIAGGSERWESSVNAIQEIEQRIKNKEQRIGVPILQASYNHPITNILLHDAARPFVSQRIINDVCKALETHRAVTVAIPATDTMYSVSENITDKVVQDIPPRATLMCAQTPQAFRLEVIAEAYDRALQDPHLQATDDCGIVHRYLPEVPICIVQGDPANRKITYKEDI
ncbi:MAG: IspD/TarI family cytidylyltransferase [Paludibacteraceae bacterium]|nr:2-C-methyl-D-erythritol 4-phosphate cytidylyltransferase [Bacteroidales bacterium]MDY4148995.1 IspD/TarI family cytidylyltransferase [Paludibacteraceae bacterium]